MRFLAHTERSVAGWWALAGLTLFDSDDAERQSLSRRRVIRTLYPQITEAPLYFYATQADSASIRTVADQCAETGFEAIILSFGSGFNPSSTNASYIAQMAKDVEYVHSKGLIIGGCESLTHGFLPCRGKESLLIAQLLDPDTRVAAYLVQTR